MAKTDMTMVNMMIQMPKELADYVSQNGIAEIVMRQQKAKIKAMIKTKVLNNGLNEKEAQKAILQERTEYFLSFFPKNYCFLFS